MQHQISTMGFGELLDMAFRLICERFFLLLGIQVLVLLPAWGVLTLYGPQAFYVHLVQFGRESTVSFNMASGGPPAAIFLGGAIVLLQMVGIAAITRVVASLYQGERTGFADALGAGLRVAIPVLATSLLFLVAFAVVGFIWSVLAGTFAGFPTFLVFSGVIVLTIYLLLPLMFLVAPVAVLERTHFVAGFSRCCKLMKGHRIRACAILVVVLFVLFIMQIPLAMIAELPGIAPVVQVGSQAIAGAFFGALAVLFYFDLRCRKEGYDLDQLTVAVADRTAFP